jgi:hypothetical protein
MPAKDSVRAPLLLICSLTWIALIAARADNAEWINGTAVLLDDDSTV